MLFGKWWPTCLGLNVLMSVHTLVSIASSSTLYQQLVDLQSQQIAMATLLGYYDDSTEQVTY